MNQSNQKQIIYSSPSLRLVTISAHFGANWPFFTNITMYTKGGIRNSQGSDEKLVNPNNVQLGEMLSGGKFLFLCKFVFSKKIH